MKESEGKKLLFNKWDASEVTVKDPGLVRYVNLTALIIPHSCGKFSKQEFNKANMPIVERLINRLMQTENNTGKKQMTIRIVREAFEIINKKTKRNPIEVLVEAIANSGPGKRRSVLNMVASMSRNLSTLHLCAGSIPQSVLLLKQR